MAEEFESLLPTNATDLERAIEQTSGERVESLPVMNETLWQAENCPENFLPFLAWALSVDKWNSEWTAGQKRNVIAAALSVHRHKGTVGAMKDAIAALGADANVEQWFEYGGEPYHFRLRLNNGTSNISIAELIDVALAAKNVRSVMDNVVVEVRIEESVPVMATSLVTGATPIIYPAINRSGGTRSPCPVIAGGVMTYVNIEIAP